MAKNSHPNKLLAVELSKLFVQQLHISVEFKIWTKLKWSRKWFCCLPTSKMKKKYENIISVFTNIEEYQLFQIGEYLVVEGTHVKQVIQVLVGALDYHFITILVSWFLMPYILMIIMCFRSREDLLFVQLDHGVWKPTPKRNIHFAGFSSSFTIFTALR